MKDRFIKVTGYHNAQQLEIHDRQGRYPEFHFLKEEDLDYVLDLLNTGKMRIPDNITHNIFRKEFRKWLSKEYKQCKPIDKKHGLYDSETAARKRLLKEIVEEFNLWGG